MARFNSPTPGQRTVNLAGGTAYTQTAKQELVSHVLTSFVQDQFYRSESDGLARLRELVQANDPFFVAQLAVYARKHFNMRTVSHVLAAELAEVVRGGTEAVPDGIPNWLPFFLAEVVQRPDDATEILALHLERAEGKAPYNAVKRGLGLALVKFDEYQLSKYRSEGKKVSLVDVVNLCHPKTYVDDHPIAKLVKGTLPTPDTWETKLTKAGQLEGAEEKAQARKDSWRELIENGQLGIMAAVRNIRNILKDDDTLAGPLAALISNEKRVRGSKMFPFRFQTAAYMLSGEASFEPQRKVLVALEKAMEIACENVPEFTGKTLVAVDTSGSMWHCLSSRSEVPIVLVAGLFAAVLAKKGADVIAYGGNASWVSYNPNDSVYTIAEKIARTEGGGTNVHSVFQLLQGRSTGYNPPVYDRIINITDEQSWVHTIHHAWRGQSTTPLPKLYEEYAERTGTRPFWYSWDLAGYGSMQMPQEKVFALAGFSEKVFDIINMMEEDKGALISEIEGVSF